MIVAVIAVLVVKVPVHHVVDVIAVGHREVTAGGAVNVRPVVPTTSVVGSAATRVGTAVRQSVLVHMVAVNVVEVPRAASPHHPTDLRLLTNDERLGIDPGDARIEPERDVAAGVAVCLDHAQLPRHDGRDPRSGRLPEERSHGRQGESVEHGAAPGLEQEDFVRGCHRDRPRSPGEHAESAR